MYFNNKLHRYVRNYHVDDNSTINHVNRKSIDKIVIELIERSIIVNKSTTFDSSSLFVIRFIVSSQTKSIEYVFRSWHYATMKILFDLKKFFINVYLNNDYIMSIIDKQFFRKTLSNCQIRIILIFVMIREIDVVQHVSSNYVIFDLWLFDEKFNDLAIIHIIKKIHLIDELRINMLLNMNIQKFENMTIFISKRRLLIDNCVEFFVVVDIVSIDKRVDRLIRIKRVISLSSHSIINVFVQIRDNFCLSFDKDYMFHSKVNFELKSKKNVYFHIVNVNIFMIQICNIIDETYIISRHVKLNRVLDYEKKDCYMTTSKNAHLIVKSKKQIFKNSFKLVLTKFVNVSMLIDELILNLVTIVNNVVFDIENFDTTTKSIFSRISLISEIVTSRDIIIYENNHAQSQLKQIIDQFSTLWIDHNQSINISKNE